MTCSESDCSWAEAHFAAFMISELKLPPPKINFMDYPGRNGE